MSNPETPNLADETAPLSSIADETPPTQLFDDTPQTPERTTANDFPPSTPQSPGKNLFNETPPMGLFDSSAKTPPNLARQLFPGPVETITVKQFTQKTLYRPADEKEWLNYTQNANKTIPTITQQEFHTIKVPPGSCFAPKRPDYYAPGPSRSPHHVQYADRDPLNMSNQLNTSNQLNISSQFDTSLPNTSASLYQPSLACSTPKQNRNSSYNSRARSQYFDPNDTFEDSSNYMNFSGPTIPVAASWRANPNTEYVDDYRGFSANPPLVSSSMYNPMVMDPEWSFTSEGGTRTVGGQRPDRTLFKHYSNVGSLDSSGLSGSTFDSSHHSEPGEVWKSNDSSLEYAHDPNLRAIRRVVRKMNDPLYKGKTFEELVELIDKLTIQLELERLLQRS